MNFYLHVRRNFCPILTEIGMCKQMRAKIPNVALHKNPSDEVSLFHADTRQERDDETCSRHLRCERTKNVTLNAIKIFSDFLNIK